MSETDLPYGDWGYGLQTPIADAMEKEIDRHAAAMKGEPRARAYYENKGAHDALKAFVGRVFDVEAEYSESVVSRQREERHSGRGRGDSMG